MVRRSLKASPKPRRALFAWLAVLSFGTWFGCGGAAPKPAALSPAPEAQTVANLAAGASFALQRPTPGAVLLSLWIAAGARDAAEPQLALAAAYWAGKKLGLTPRVLPEGTEFSLLCDTTRESVEACAGRLVSVLDPPWPSASDAAALRERVRAQRAQAASDASRRAEQLALEALLGDAARGLFPLGSEAQDARIDAAALRAFLEHNYAAERALLVGLGDLKQDSLQRVARRMKARGAAVRARRVLSAPAPGLRVEVADSGHIALVLSTSGVERAASLCERFRAIHGDAHASISSLRGATLVHLLLPSGELPFARLQSAVFDLHRLLIEPSQSPPAPPPDTLEGLARAIGEAWVVRGAEGAPLEEGALGVGLLWPRTDRAVDSDSAALDKVKERAAEALAAGTRNSAVSVSTRSDGPVLRATTGNGARLEIVRRGSERWFAAGLRWAGGSATDAATGHGRAALLATLMADGCGLASGRALDLKLSSLQATLWPMVDANGLGVGISAPAAHTEEALDLLLRCALRPAFQARAIEDARARLLRALWQDERRKLESALGQLLTPAAPGSLAPWGTPAGVAKVEAAELRRQHAQRMRGPALSVWVAADREPAELASFIARRLSHLSASESPLPEPQPGPSSDMAGALVDDAQLRVVIGLSAARDTKASLAAGVFAAAFAQALTARLGQADWWRGDSVQQRAFAGAALRLREEQLETLEGQVAGVLGELRDKPDAYYRSALDQARLGQSAALSSARGWVEAAFAGHASASYTLDAELGQIRKLAKAQPSFLVLRPRP